jgi:hypothetical protein
VCNTFYGIELEKEILNHDKQIKGMIETLEIRLAQNLNKKLESEIQHVVDDVVKKTSGISMKFYKKNNLNSDYLIIIMYLNEPGTKGIEFGQRIKSALKDFGMVNHNLWNEVNPKNEKQ